MYTNDDVRINLSGFEHDPEYGAFVKSLIYPVHEEAPSDATTTASFTRRGNKVTGAIQIASSQGVFSAKAHGRNGRKVVHSVVRKIEAQLRDWKSERFHPLWAKAHRFYRKSRNFAGSWGHSL